MTKKTLTALTAALLAGALAAPVAFAQSDHMSSGNKTAMSSDHMANGDHMAKGDHMASGDHMAMKKKAMKKKAPAKKADAMSSGEMSH